MSHRIISTLTDQRSVRQLIQSVFSAEVINPSNELWIAAPWVSDIPLLDNRTHQYATLEPLWPAGFIPLCDVLEWLASAGTNIHLAVRIVSHNEAFLDRIHSRLANHSNCAIYMRRNLHFKGIVGESWYLRGSMNLTHTAIGVGEEGLEYSTIPEQVHTARLEMRRYSEEG